MSAKRKSSGKDNQADPNLESNQNVELEKKVDAMMSVDEAAQADAKSEETQKPETEKAHLIWDEASEPAGAPLLPTDKLPNLDSKPPKAEVEVDEDTEPAIITRQPAADYRPTPVKPAESEEKLPDDLGLEEDGTGKAVDEIVAADSDKILNKEDEEASMSVPTPVRPSNARSQKSGLRKFFGSKAFRRTILILLLLGIAAAAAVPTSRYYALNAAGVRSASSVTVLDESTGQPLKNAEFSIAGTAGKTNETGSARIENLKLGPATMKISKPAFAEVNQPVTVGWGSNPLGDFRLKAVGTQYKFKIVDYLSKKPVAKAEAISGQASSVSNENGEIVLTVPQTDQEKAEVEIKADSYRIEKMTLGISQKDVIEIQLVPYKKHVFISKRAGTYDVYKVDVDGKNEEKVLPGNGSEQLETMTLASHPTKNIAALISSRDNIRNKDGYNLGTLNVIDLEDNSVTKVTQSERIQLVDWVGDRLVYIKVGEGAKSDSTDRHRLTSYDIDSGAEKELASTNYFNDILAVNGQVYYTPAAYNVNGSVGLFKIKIDGTDKKTVYDKEVWNILRTSYDKLNVSMGEEWFELNLDNDALSRLDGPPAVQKTRLYFEGPGNGMSLWVDDRDGKGTLLKYDQKTKEDKVVQAQSGLKNPVRWLSEKHIIFRVTNNQETADYIFNSEGGEARKIRDVTDTAGIDRWYYY